MRKRIAFRKLSRTPTHKWAMLRNMVTSLIYHERIVTTTPKAKELKRLAEWIIGFGKDGKDNRGRIIMYTALISNATVSLLKKWTLFLIFLPLFSLLFISICGLLINFHYFLSRTLNNKGACTQDDRQTQFSARSQRSQNYLKCSDHDTQNVKVDIREYCIWPNHDREIRRPCPLLNTSIDLVKFELLSHQLRSRRVCLLMF